MIGLFALLLISFPSVYLWNDRFDFCCSDFYRLCLERQFVEKFSLLVVATPGSALVLFLIILTAKIQEKQTLI